MSLSSFTDATSPQWKGWVENPSLPYGRGTLNIIWSCLFTILICTWTIQHPMVPADGEWWLWVAVRKARMMAITVLAPEMLIGPAIGEYLLAKESISTLETAGIDDWKITHGFFALMGGFKISGEPDKKFSRVNATGIAKLKADASWEVVPITEDEIEDKSKANALIKATAVLQSLWLVVQCCARAEQGLPITPLELATTAFVGCTLVTYVAWFFKPQEVKMPIVILKRSKFQDSFRGGKESSPRSVPTSVPLASAPERSASAPTRQAVPNRTSAEKGTVDRVVPLEEAKMRSKTMPECFEKGVSSNPMTPDDIETIVKQGWKEEMLISESYRSSILKALKPSGKGRMTTFHYFAGHHQHSLRISLSAGAVFGAIHTIGWNFSFPSKTEAILWRVASTAAAALPAILLVPLLLTIWGGPLYTWLNKIRGESVEPKQFGRVFGPADWIVMILYASMRLYLLLALFITFRSQPEEIYATVSWSRYIPHFT